MTNRDKALTEARLWLGTPYRHRASSREIGTPEWGADFFGLLRGVWRAVYGDDLAPKFDYVPDWGADGDEDLLAILRMHMDPIPVDQARPGDVLVFRMTEEAPARHLAILSVLPDARHPEPRILHAYWGRSVVESWMGKWWQNRRLGIAFTWREAQS